ncbi:hypothetical protein RM543_01495 [Roseicyclus sp. F158]|uniref:Uncharacterized protein n=1 Tax=Tropicimonas omnivorans TaxID=3075590 RepID=A0ABU3DDW7_9RHOB|nr:hypothetical protein [Roseicyclus sp. F158]MDT0681342.1 hypothetical protein [Roseicyclus sp. F158]
MNDILPDAVLRGLDEARRARSRKSSRMRVKAGDRTFVILRHWDGGFSLDATDAPGLRGHVDLYDGQAHVRRALVMSSAEVDGERIFEIKSSTTAMTAPPADFADAPEPPAGLLPAY